MFRTLVTKEILGNLLNTRFAVAYGLCVVLMVGCTANMLTDFLARKRTFEHEMSIYERTYTETKPWDWLPAANRNVARPPLLMQVFCLGSERQADTRANINPYFQPYFFGEAKQDVAAMLFPAVDMLFVIGTLLSLIIFLLTSDAVSGEHQAGTLKLVLSCPVPRDTVILSKWVGGFTCLAIPYVLSWLVVALLLVLSRSVTVSADDWFRIVALAGVGLLYVATVFSLAMMVSVVVRRPDVSALVLMLIWVMLLVALPSLSIPIAWLRSPAQGTQELQTSFQFVITRGRDDYGKTHPSLKQQRFGDRNEGDLTEEEYPEFMELASRDRVNFFGHARDRILGMLRDDFAQLTAMDNYAAWLMRLSPAGCLQRAFTAIAGTGLGRERELAQAMEQFTPAAYNAAETKAVTGRLPNVTFVVRRTPAPAASAAALVDIGILSLMCLLFFLTAFSAFVRSEVI